MSLSLSDIKKLQQKKYRSELGYFLVEGEHLIIELEKALTRHPELATSQLLVTEAYANWPSVLPKTIISEKQMAQLADTKTPQGIMAAAPLLISYSHKAEHNAKTIYLYEVQDPGNLGTILRTLAWFGGFDCLLSPGSVDPYNPKVVRASMGAIFHVPIRLDVNPEDIAREFNHIACLDMRGQPPSEDSFKRMDCYVFGNEARGLPETIKHLPGIQTFTIPGNGTIESLNLATAVNICVYEVKRQG